ncbi:MAG: radical SAM protein [Endomicrobia bacterium]|nr:radical SAM protein [Endomicrobiia bacterium]
MSKKLAHAVWEITLKCNAKCVHCASSAGVSRESELSLDESLKICDELISSGCARITLIGGETFLNPNWKDIAAKLSDGGIAVSVVTNALLLNKDNIDFLSGIKAEVIGISIDGLANTHDSIRQIPGLYDKIFSVLEYVKEKSIPATAITTLSKKNIYEIDALKDNIVNSLFDAWQFQIAVPYGRMPKELALDIFEYYLISLYAAKLKLAAPKQLEVVCMHDFGYYSKTIPLRKGLFSWTGCPAGKCVLGIRSDGKVHGCLSMYDEKFCEGDLRKQTLKEIFKSKDMCSWNKRFTRYKTLKGFCKECEYGIVCLGGCSDVAHSVTGSVGENPYCHHAIEARCKTYDLKDEFEKIFKDITCGKLKENGEFFLKSNKKLTKDYVESLNIGKDKKYLLNLIAQ